MESNLGILGSSTRWPTGEYAIRNFYEPPLGKLNFYLAAVDDLLKSPENNPSIGLLLCQKKSQVIAEYALKRTDGPIGIAEYRLLHELPKELINDLPSTEILESKLSEKTNIAIKN